MPEKTINKVVFEHDDGTLKYLEGQELKNWLDMVSSVCMIAEVHNCNPDWKKIKWKEGLKREKKIHY